MPSFNNPDIHHDLGPRQTAASMEEASGAIRAAVPGATCEGSMGAERSWWLNDGGVRRLVGHQWPVRRRDGLGKTYYRVMVKQDGIDLMKAHELPAGAVSTTEERLPTRLEAQAAAKVLLRCNGADLSAWTDDVWPDQSMDEALKMLAAPTDEQKKWPLGSFDTLTCPECGTDCDPKSVSVQNDKPTVAYACGGCGRSWRIGPSGDETHVRSRKS